MEIGKKAKMIKVREGKMRIITEELSTIKGHCVLGQCQWLWQHLGMIRGVQILSMTLL